MVFRKLNDSEQTRIAHPATILALVGQKLHVSTLACINLENKIITLLVGEKLCRVM